MNRRVLAIVVGWTVILSACSNLGLGEAACATPGANVSSANVLTVQAVPTAKYTPCLNELRLGWDSVSWFARSGEAGFAISHSMSQFLTSIVTESCDVSGATAVESTQEDVEQYEDIEAEFGDIEIVLVPSGDVPLLEAQGLAERFGDAELNDRSVNIIVDARLDQSVSRRVNEALADIDYVWIIEQLDAEEGTVEVRGNHARIAGGRLTPDDALDLIEDLVPEPFYRGEWYFTFEGGCITYTFDAKGVVAESVAADARDALGFYPASELRDLARELGFEF